MVQLFSLVNVKCSKSPPSCEHARLGTGHSQPDAARAPLTARPVRRRADLVSRSLNTFNIDLNATRPGNPAQRVSREEPSVETVVWWSPGGTAKKWSHGLFDRF